MGCLIKLRRRQKRIRFRLPAGKKRVLFSKDSGKFVGYTQLRISGGSLFNNGEAAEMQRATCSPTSSAEVKYVYSNISAVTYVLMALTEINLTLSY